MIIHNATIHSPIERFATALHIDNGVIVWMGDEDTAHMRSSAFPNASLVDVGKALVLPAFHHPFVTTQTQPSLLNQGVTAIHQVFDTPHDLVEPNNLDFTAIYHDNPTPPSIHLVRDQPEAVLQTFSTPPPTGVERAIWVSQPDEVAILQQLHDLGVRGRAYISATTTISAELLTGWQVVVIFDGPVHFRLGELTQAGIPFSIGGSASPWELITQALLTGPHPISARAAFTAMTRGAWRLTPGNSSPRGVLAVGSPADIAIWQVDALAVQAPDESRAIWSTDKKAGTPLLPALGDDETPPQLRGLIRSGEVLSDQGLGLNAS